MSRYVPNKHILLVLSKIPRKTVSEHQEVYSPVDKGCPGALFNLNQCDKCQTLAEQLLPQLFSNQFANKRYQHAIQRYAICLVIAMTKLHVFFKREHVLSLMV